VEEQLGTGKFAMDETNPRCAGSVLTLVEEEVAEDFDDSGYERNVESPETGTQSACSHTSNMGPAQNFDVRRCP
jgi:hypothetical protein